MYLDCCVRDDPTPYKGVALDTIFYIDGDESYSIPYKNVTPGKIYLVYTLAGQGSISYDGVSYAAGANSFLLMRPQRDFSYRCAGTQWRFWWYEFYAPIELPADTVVHCPPTQTSLELFSQILHYAKQDAWDVAGALLIGTLALLGYGATHNSASQREEALVQAAEGYIRENLATVTVEELAQTMALEERTLRNLFYRTLDISPKRFITKIRIETVAHLLLSTGLRLEAIAQQTGFSSQYHMSRCFTENFGVTLSQYRKHIHP